MNIYNLSIRQLDERKSLYEQRISDIKQIVEDRWAKLLGYGRGYFLDFTYKNLYVYVKVASRYDDYYATDTIHNHYFAVSEKQAVADFEIANKFRTNLNYNSTVWTPSHYLQDIQKVKSVNFS